MSPELTVCMPVEGSIEHLSGAVQSVLKQQSTDFELVLLVKEDLNFDLLSDPRVSVVRMKSNQAEAYNEQVERSSAAFFAFVGCSDMVLTEAFRTMIDACKSSNDIGMVHSFFYPLDKNGKITRERFRKYRDSFGLLQSPEFDVKRELLIRGLFLGPFRLFRKEAIKACGGFDPWIEDPDYGLILKVAGRYQICSVPEYLYGRRIEERPTRRQEFRVWKRRVSTVLKLRKNIAFLRESQYSVRHWLVNSLRLALQPKGDQTIARLPKRQVFKFLNSGLNLLYYSIVASLHWWRLDWFPTHRQKSLNSGDRIAYCLWRFPVMSQTFVHREMDALIQCGIALSIIAEGQEDPELADEKARSLLPHSSYLLPMDPKILSVYLKHFLLRKPFTCLNLFLFLMTHRYCRFKSIDKDWSVFSKAVYMAGKLRSQNIQHIHSPWADESAVIAMVASRLLNIRFSVQARAHEIHRQLHQFAFFATLPHADFMITNTQYNQAHIQSLQKSFPQTKIITIYNGVDLEQLQPSAGKEIGGQLNLLCVARLIEQKGLIYLLKACRKLLDQGCQFRCEIVGGPEHELYINYFLLLKKLHTELGLTDSVLLTGPLCFEDVRKKYCSADIFVLPCVIADDGSRDIIPNAILEAMAMKLPVVSTHLAGIPEMIEDGISGLLVPPGDEEALAKAVIRLIEDPELRSSLGEHARKRVEERFDIAKNIRRYAELFEWNLHKPEPVRALHRSPVAEASRERSIAK